MLLFLLKVSVVFLLCAMVLVLNPVVSSYSRNSQHGYHKSILDRSLKKWDFRCQKFCYVGNKIWTFKLILHFLNLVVSRYRKCCWEKNRTCELKCFQPLSCRIRICFWWHHDVICILNSTECFYRIPFLIFFRILFFCYIFCILLRFASYLKKTRHIQFIRKEIKFLYFRKLCRAVFLSLKQHLLSPKKYSCLISIYRSFFQFNSYDQIKSSGTKLYIRGYLLYICIPEDWGLLSDFSLNELYTKNNKKCLGIKL